MSVILHCGDCLDVLPSLPENSIDACLTDPPYHLASIVKRFGGENAAPTKSNGPSGVYKRASAGFMGQRWDGGDVAFRPETWSAVFRVLKPGAHLAAFGAAKNFHRLACAIEDAGFEIRDVVMWLFGQGFPKSHDVSKGIDKALGAERNVISLEKVRDIRNGHGRSRGEGIHSSERDGPVYMERAISEPATEEARRWAGWGTALKPAYEPIIIARKPLSEKSVAANVLRWGTGAINVDGCRIETDETIIATRTKALGSSSGGIYGAADVPGVYSQHDDGRWPANVAHDGSAEIVDLFPHSGGGRFPRSRGVGGIGTSGHRGQDGLDVRKTDGGSAARFFYCAKATKKERAGSKHPTVKPISLLRWLIRMICSPGGIVLDPFAGTGTTGEAAHLEGRNAILIERELQYQGDICHRLMFLEKGFPLEVIDYPEAA